MALESRKINHLGNYQYVSLKDGYSTNSATSHAESFQINNNSAVDFHADNEIVSTDFDKIETDELLPIQPVIPAIDNDAQEFAMQEHQPVRHQVLKMVQAKPADIKSLKKMFEEKHIFKTLSKEQRREVVEVLINYDRSF